MTETQPPAQRPLFRPEAVEAHARGRGVEDEGLELKEGRTAWAFRLLLLLLIVAIAIGLTVNVDETARGYAHVAGRQATVDLPVGAYARVRPGLPVTLHSARGHVTVVGRPSAANGVPIVPVLVEFESGEVVEGDATVRLARRTLAELLLRRGDG